MESVLRKILRNITFLVSLMLISPSLFATHIIGGEMSYVCLGNDQYQVTLKVFRDCYNGVASFDNPTSITIFNASNAEVPGSPFAIYLPGTDTLDNGSNNSCLVIPPGICVEEADFVMTVTLPASPGGYTMVYQRCCRNSIIFNIVDPSNTGTSYVATIPDSSLATCNSSPYFNSFPPTVICVDQPFTFNHSATDPDGDDLVYQLCAPYVGGSSVFPYPVPASPPPYDFVQYNAPYTAEDPIGGNPAMEIDPATGVLTVTPNTIGNFVVGVCVEEYRNGNLMGEHKRDFQFNVVECTVLLSVSFLAPDGEVNLPIQFTDQSTTNSGYINSWSWDFGDGGTSNLQNPTYTYQAGGDYIVTLDVTTSTGCIGEAVQGIHIDFPNGIMTPEIPYSDRETMIYNLYGQPQSFQMFHRVNEEWTSSDVIPSGIYFIQYKTSSGMFVKKISIQH